MYKTCSRLFPFLLIVLVLTVTSCVNVQTQQVNQQINVDTAITIPKHLALKYANDFLDKHFVGDFYKAKFFENHVHINRQYSKYIEGAAINQNYDYNELMFIANIMEVQGGSVHIKQYTLVLIDKDDAHSPDLYESRFGLSQKVLNPSKYMYAWGKETDAVPRKDFEKFLTSLLSLGIQVLETKPQDY